MSAIQPTISMMSPVSDSSANMDNNTHIGSSLRPWAAVLLMRFRRNSHDLERPCQLKDRFLDSVRHQLRSDQKNEGLA
jgi:hypothetical protein